MFRIAVCRRENGGDVSMIRADTLIRYKPRFFNPDFDTGRPTLSEEGLKAVQEELERTKH